METSTLRTINPIDEMNEIITRIVNLVMVQQVYCINRLRHDPITELIIFISDKCSKTLIEIMLLIDMVFEDYPDYCYRLYHTHQAKSGIKKGNLFFYDICSAENLCYIDPATERSLFAEAQDLEKIIDKAKKGFNGEIAKIQAFNDGAGFYWEKENYALTTFMVHQQIELAYRAIELFTMGKDKVTHFIRVHQKYVKPYLPALGKLFDESDDFENKLMQQLDDAYLAVRYGNDYQINKDQLLKAREKGAQVQRLIEEIYEKTIHEFEQKLLNRKIDPVIIPAEEEAEEEEKTTKISKDTFIFSDRDADLIKIITEYLIVDRIYCINRKNTSSTCHGIFQKDALEQNSAHFLLLVITKESCNPDSFSVQNSVNQSKEISATVTLLVHSLKNVNDALMDNNRFFHEILRSDQLIYQHEAISGLIELPKYDHLKIFPKPDFVWDQRKQRAAALREAAVNMSEHEAEIVEISLLNQTMEQLCLGFIFVSMGYKPNQQSLKHLVNICRCITPMFDEVFPTGTEDDKSIFETLIDSIKGAKYHIPYNVDPTDVGLLHRRCSAWMEKAEELVSK